MEPGDFREDPHSQGSVDEFDPGALVQRTENMTCSHCALVLKGKSQLDAHRKKVHQEKVEVKTITGVTKELMRNKDTKVFERPAQGCTFSQKAPNRIQAHVSKCEGHQVTLRTMVRDSQPLGGTLVQHGEDIKGAESPITLNVHTATHDMFACSGSYAHAI